MRNNVPKLHDLKVYDPKILIIELDLTEYFENAPPVPKDLDKAAIFIPRNYFITSGEAIEKTKYMLIDLSNKMAHLLDVILKSIMGAIRDKKAVALAHFKAGKSLPKSMIPYKTYYDYIVTSKKDARNLLMILKKFRGKNCFLETEWDSHRLLCISKNPRMKDEVDEE